MKEYMKPEVEIISLVADEAITSDLEGELSLSTSPFND